MTRSGQGTRAIESQARQNHFKLHSQLWCCPIRSREKKSRKRTIPSPVYQCKNALRRNMPVNLGSKQGFQSKFERAEFLSRSTVNSDTVAEVPVTSGCSGFLAILPAASSRRRRNAVSRRSPENDRQCLLLNVKNEKTYLWTCLNTSNVQSLLRRCSITLHLLENTTAAPFQVQTMATHC